MVNIAELLKDCPIGMELDCPIYGGVTTFDNISEHKSYPITIKVLYGDFICSHQLTKYGQLLNTPNNTCIIFPNTPNNTCIIFPKGKTTWEGFVPPCKFKEGDVVVSNYGDIHLLRTEDSSYCAYRNSLETKLDNLKTTNITVARLATEEEKEKLFKAIKDNGYRWNDETKTLDKLPEPKFKLGDRVETFDNLYATVCACYFDKNKNCYMYDVTISHIDLVTYAENQLKLREYKIKPKFKMWDRVKSIYNNNQYDIIGITETHYTLEEVENKFKYVEPIIEDKNLELVPKKFDINTLVPFESRVLVSGEYRTLWRPAIFGCYMKDANAPYYTLGGTCWHHCIPYEGNEHLLGTTDDCDDYYKV